MADLRSSFLALRKAFFGLDIGIEDGNFFS